MPPSTTGSSTGAALPARRRRTDAGRGATTGARAGVGTGVVGIDDSRPQPRARRRGIVSSSSDEIGSAEVGTAEPTRLSSSSSSSSDSSSKSPSGVAAATTTDVVATAEESVLEEGRSTISQIGVPPLSPSPRGPSFSSPFRSSTPPGFAPPPPSRPPPRPFDVLSHSASHGDMPPVSPSSSAGGGGRQRLGVLCMQRSRSNNNRARSLGSGRSVGSPRARGNSRPLALHQASGHVVSSLPPPPPLALRRRSTSTHSGSDGGRGGLEGFLAENAEEEEYRERTGRRRSGRSSSFGAEELVGLPPARRRSTSVYSGSDGGMGGAGSFSGDLSVEEVGEDRRDTEEMERERKKEERRMRRLQLAAMDRMRQAQPLHVQGMHRSDVPIDSISATNGSDISPPPSNRQLSAASVEVEPSPSMENRQRRRHSPDSLPLMSPPPSSHGHKNSGDTPPRPPAVVVPPPRPAELAARERLVERERQARLETERARLKRQIALNRRIEEDEYSGDADDGIDFGDGEEDDADKTDGSVVGTIGDDILSDVATDLAAPHAHARDAAVVMETPQDALSSPPEPRPPVGAVAVGAGESKEGDLELGFAMERFLSDGVVVAPDAPSGTAAGDVDGAESDQVSVDGLCSPRGSSRQLVSGQRRPENNVASLLMANIDVMRAVVPPLAPPAGIMLVNISDSRVSEVVAPGADGIGVMSCGSSATSSLLSDLVGRDRELTQDLAEANGTVPLVERDSSAVALLEESPNADIAGSAASMAMGMEAAGRISAARSSGDSDLVVASLPSRSTASHQGTASRALSEDLLGVPPVGRSGSDLGRASSDGGGRTGASNSGHYPRLARLTESDILEMAEIDHASIGNAPPHSVRDDADGLLHSFSPFLPSGRAGSNIFSEDTRTTVQESVSATESARGSRTYSLGRASVHSGAENERDVEADEEEMLAVAVSPPGSIDGDESTGSPIMVDGMIEERLRRMEGSSARLSGAGVANSDGHSDGDLAGMAVHHNSSSDDESIDHQPTCDTNEGPGQGVNFLVATLPDDAESIEAQNRRIRPGTMLSGMSSSSQTPLVASLHSLPQRPIQVEGFDYDKWTDADPTRCDYDSSSTGSFEHAAVPSQFALACTDNDVMTDLGTSPLPIDEETGMGSSPLNSTQAYLRNVEILYHDYGSAADVGLEDTDMHRGDCHLIPFVEAQRGEDLGTTAGPCTIDRLCIGPSVGDKTDSARGDVESLMGDARESDPLLGVSHVPREVMTRDGATNGFSHDFDNLPTDTGRGIVDSVFSSVRSVSTNDIVADMNDSETYLKSGMFKKACPERLSSLLATLAIEIPVLFLISGGSDRICLLMGRRRYQLLMAFLPLSSAISGNCGLQASTLTARAISHEHVTKSTFYCWLACELGAAFYLGLCMGTILGVMAYYFGGFDAIFGLSIAVAQLMSVFAAGLTGTLAPLISSSIFHRDSGKWCGLLVTAFQDVVGSVAMVTVSYYLLVRHGPADDSIGDLCGA